MRDRKKIRLFGHLLSTIVGMILLVCFILPSFEGCSIVGSRNEVYYPYRAISWGEIFTVWQFLIPYIGGFLIALLHINIIRTKSSHCPIERNILMFISAFVLGFCMIKFLPDGIAYMFEKGFFYDLQTNLYLITGLIVLLGLLSVYIIGTLRNIGSFKKIALYQATFATIYALWHGWLIFLYSDKALYGLKITLGCMIALVILADIIYRNA